MTTKLLCLNMSMAVGNVIEVPVDIVQMSNSLVYTLYDTPVLFQVVPPNDGSNLSVEADTMVVGFTLFEAKRYRNISGLVNPIIITFQSIRAQNKMVCEIFLIKTLLKKCFVFHCQKPKT